MDYENNYSIKSIAVGLDEIYLKVLVYASSLLVLLGYMDIPLIPLYNQL